MWKSLWSANRQQEHHSERPRGLWTPMLWLQKGTIQGTAHFTVVRLFSQTSPVLCSHLRSLSSVPLSGGWSVGLLVKIPPNHGHTSQEIHSRRAFWEGSGELGRCSVSGFWYQNKGEESGWGINNIPASRGYAGHQLEPRGRSYSSPHPLILRTNKIFALGLILW